MLPFSCRHGGDFLKLFITDLYFLYVAQKTLLMLLPAVVYFSPETENLQALHISYINTEITFKARNSFFFMLVLSIFYSYVSLS